MTVETEVQQNRANKSQRKDRKFDTTELDLESMQGGYIVHRDYAAHYFKYGFAGKYCPGKSILEIGCGSKTPLAHTMVFGEGFYNSPPKIYVGLDYGEITSKPGNSWVNTHDNIDATKQSTRDFLDEHYGKFDLIVNLEVIEHMGKDSGDELLKTIHNSLADDGIAIVSTPVFNGKKARNHIHEYTIPELADSFERAKLEVVDRYGTFMSAPDLKKAIKENESPEVAQGMLDLYDRVHAFYPHGVSAAWFAPAFPDYARNNVWIVKRK